MSDDLFGENLEMGQEKNEKVDEDPLMMEEDGLDGYMAQEDEVKYPAGDMNMISQNLEQNDDDIFAGTDMANDRVVDPDPLGDNMQASLESKDENSEIGQWEAEHHNMIIKKRNKARQDKEELLEKAKQDIQKFYLERKEKQAKIKVSNKEHEETYFSEMKTLMQYGAPWEKVGKIVNLTLKPNEKPGISKVDRMRTLLIQLKNEKTQ